MRLDVYDATNTTKLGELTKAHDIAWFSDLREPGTLQFTIDTTDAADLALVDFLRVIRVNEGGSDLEAFVVRNTAAELAVPDERPFVTFQCQGLLSVLGYQAGGAVLWPYGGLEGLQQSPRWFGPMGFDHMDDGNSSEPTTGGALTRENWPDPRAERFIPSSHAVYRRVLTGVTGRDGPARMWLTSAHWTEVRVWFDGAELQPLNSPVGDRTVRTVDIDYDGEDHVIAFYVSGEPPSGQTHSLGWTWANIDDDENIEGRLFTSFNSTTYSGPTPPTAPFWEAWEDIDGPGVTVGFVMKTAVDEAQAEGLLAGVTYDFDADDDSGSTPWEHRFTRSFRIQKLGGLLEPLAAFGCEPAMTPTGQLRLWQQRGTDRTASVDVRVPFSLSVATQGPQAGEGPYETEAGLGRVTNTAFETRWGTRLEDYISLGEDLGPETVLDAVERYILAHSSERPEVDVSLPDDVTPYTHVFLGDLVRGRTPDGDEDLRVVSIRCDIDDTGHANWGAMLEAADA
jgi:hypothetical protein